MVVACFVRRLVRDAQATSVCLQSTPSPHGRRVDADVRTALPSTHDIIIVVRSLF